MAGNTNVPGRSTTLIANTIGVECPGDILRRRLAQFEDSVAPVAEFGWDIDRRTVGLRRDEEVAAFPLQAQLLPVLTRRATAYVRRHAAQDDTVAFIVQDMHVARIAVACAYW